MQSESGDSALHSKNVAVKSSAHLPLAFWSALAAGSTFCPVAVTTFSPSALTLMLPGQPQFPPVFCCGRCLGPEQFLPTQLVRRTSFHVPDHSARPIHTPDCAAKCSATTPEDRLWD